HLAASRTDGSNQSGEGQGMKLIELAATEVKLLQDRIGQLGRAFGFSEPDRGAAHDDGTMEQTPRRRQGQQRAHFAAAARLAKNGYTRRIATEGGNVVVNPLKGCDHV